MKPILGLVASAALTFAPLAGVAQTADQITEQLNREQLQNTPPQQQPAVQGAGGGTVATPTQASALPTLSTIPVGAVVIGGFVILGGVIIGIAASDDDDSSTSTTTTN